MVPAFALLFVPRDSVLRNGAQIEEKLRVCRLECTVPSNTIQDAIVRFQGMTRGGEEWSGVG